MRYFMNGENCVMFKKKTRNKKKIVVNCYEIDLKKKK